MKVARKHIPARHDWLNLTDEKGKIVVSALACRHEICIDVTVDGVTAFDYVTPRQLANALLKLANDPHEK